jgi:hypothetical protein
MLIGDPSGRWFYSVPAAGAANCEVTDAGCSIQFDEWIAVPPYPVTHTTFFRTTTRAAKLKASRKGLHESTESSLEKKLYKVTTDEKSLTRMTKFSPYLGTVKPFM